MRGRRWESGVPFKVVVLCLISFLLVFLGLQVVSSEHMFPLRVLGCAMICIPAAWGEEDGQSVSFHFLELGGCFRAAWDTQPCGCHLSLGHLARQSWAWLLSARTARKRGQGGGEGSEGVGQGAVGSSIKKSRKGNPLVWAWVPSDSTLGKRPKILDQP